MPLTVAVQMDPIERIRIAGDSTFALLLEAQARGHRLLHYTPDRLRLNGSRVEAMAEPLTRARTSRAITRASASRRSSIFRRVDVVLLRQDPPFDLAYIARPTCSSASTRRRWSSTIRAACATRRKSCSSWIFPELMPPTLDHPRPGGDRGVPRRARRSGDEAALRLRRRGGLQGRPCRTRISARCSTSSARPFASPG